MKSIIKSALFLAVMLSVTPLLAGGPGIFHDEKQFKLQAEAASLALLHYLEFTPEQRGEVKQILTPIRSQTEAVKELGEKWNRKVMEPRLSQVISDLKKGQKPAPPSAANLSEFEQFQQEMRDYRIQARSALERVINFLTPEQQEKLRSFHPHEYIGFSPSPPPGPFGREPLKLIAEIRTMPPEEFTTLVDRLQDREPRGRKQGPNRAERVQTLINFMEEVRKMSEEEFAKHSERLQEEYDQLRPPRPEKGERMQGEKRGPDKPGKKGMKGNDRPGKGPMKRHHLELIILSEAFYNAL